MEELASILGPDETLFISQDDKARVPIGKTAANKQTSLVMHLDYRVRLPDHDWVVADKHKLIASVYAFIKIDPDKLGDTRAVTYSGPTFITIRSGKHSSSTLLSHATDFNELMNCPDFEDFCRNKVCEFKPVVMMTTDGGPDENPRYEKTIQCAVDHFKKFNFDVLFLATNAPRRSAFNRVERRMSHLSRDLAGLVLDHQKLGMHLNEKGETVDLELEKRNFEHAGTILGEIWSDTVIDTFPTIACYVKPEDSELSVIEKVTEKWKAAHVRESHYFLQIVKCSDRNCCTSPRSSYFELIKQFLPAPLCITSGIKICDNSDSKNKFVSLFLRMALKNDDFRVGSVNEIPFDKFCPSLQEIVNKRMCECGLYHGTIKSMVTHRRFCQPTRRTSVRQPVQTAARTTRPKRLAAIRQGERMVVWTSRMNSEHVDWFDDIDDGNNEVDVQEIYPVPVNNDVEDIIPIIEMDEMIRNCWEDC